MAAGYRSARSAAIKFGWSPSTYASHENGQTPVPIDAAFIYGKAFKTNAAWILLGVGPRQESIDAMLADQPESVWEGAREMVALYLKHRR